MQTHVFPLSLFPSGESVVHGITIMSVVSNPIYLPPRQAGCPRGGSTSKAPPPVSCQTLGTQGTGLPSSRSPRSEGGGDGGAERRKEGSMPRPVLRAAGGEGSAGARQLFGASSVETATGLGEALGRPGVGTL